MKRTICLALCLLFLLPLGVFAATEPGCSHRYSSWSAIDGQTHSAACDLCGAVTERPHEFEEVWSTDAKHHMHRCSYCDQTADLGEHTFPDAWEGDEVNHIRLCTVCQVVGQSRDHSWDEGTVRRRAGLFKDGSREYTCTVCSFVRTQTLPAHRVPGIILVSMLGLALLAGATLLVLRRLKIKRK